MKETIELPCNIDMEKQLLGAMLIRRGEVIPKVINIVSAEESYRPEHRIIFQTMVRMYAQGNLTNSLGIMEEINKIADKGKVDVSYAISVELSIHTNAYAVTQTNLRRLILLTDEIKQEVQLAVNSPDEVIARAQRSLEEITRANSTFNKTDFNDYLVDAFRFDVVDMKAYADRSTGFTNIDEVPFFTPGLYVIGATPAADKTTFCQQLLHKLANKGETCIYCSYEMSRLELFKRNDKTVLTAAQIRRGGTSAELERLIVDLAEKFINFRRL